MWWIYYDGKINVKNVSVLINLHQDFKMVKNIAWTTMEILSK